jgi:hypothetical protein
VFIERVVERKEHFRRFVDRMVNPVHTCAEQEKGGQAHHQSDCDGQASQGGEEGSISMSPGAPAPTDGCDRIPASAPPAPDDSLRMRAGRHGLTITQKGRIGGLVIGLLAERKVSLFSFYVCFLRI